ncbi:coiled-coil domain-containing protein 181 [Narcine bancroftii]|uniref:coiled-coil domain-containing protein 181 n=1 Tax=Narcine bancroftii TaxID=1343680 RepID=UPI0038315B36
MSEENSISSQVEEYEDDFEKDLDWLINEETKNGEEDPEDYEDENIEAKIDKELCDEEEQLRESLDDEKNFGGQLEIEREMNEELYKDTENANEGENVTMVTSAPASDTVDESSFKELKQEDQQDEEQSEEIKDYIMKKIEQANKDLKDEDPVDQNRERRLKFKDDLIDLVVPPAEFAERERINGEITGPMSIKHISNDVQNNNDKQPMDHLSVKYISNDVQRDNYGEVTDQMSQIHISNAAQKTDGTEKQQDENKNKDKDVLMEKDGKFELLSLQDFESQDVLPQISVAFNEIEWEQSNNSKGRSLSSSQSSLSPYPTEELNALKPPEKQKYLVTSPLNTQNGIQNGLPRRTRSAVVSSKQSSHLIVPENKEFNWRTPQKKEHPKIEIRARKTDEEEQKKEENKLAFGIWLQKKKEQHQEEKRIQCAKEIEKKNSKEFRDPNEAFNLWLKKKREQQIKEQQIEAMRKREQDYNSRLHTREDSEKAFKQWLRRKKAEKRAEQLAAKERYKKFLMEARRVKRMQTLLCTLNESKSLQFDNYGYRF